MMYFKSLLATALSTLFTTLIYGQVGIGTNSPVASAKLEISSTIQGFLPPRMTTAQRDQISSPAIGLIIFNTTTETLEIRTSSGWLALRVISSSQEVSSVKIGNQIWMLENLNVTTYRDGTPISEVSNQTTWDNLSTGGWCNYSNDPSFASIYGRLYNYYAVVDSRGLCPSGWHVPNNEEYNVLANFLGGNVGGKMKSAGFVTPNTGATNSSGFTALPGGWRQTGSFSSEGNAGMWWTSTEVTGTTAHSRTLSSSFSDFYVHSYNKKWGASVRCIKD
jgi:uncharacterized protein (TIGR02145 family)